MKKISITLSLFTFFFLPAIVSAQGAAVRKAVQYTATPATSIVKSASKAGGTRLKSLSQKTSSALSREAGAQLSLTMQQTAPKQLLNRHQAFQNEIMKMNELLPQLQLLHANSPTSEIAQAELYIRDNVVNQTLLKNLMELFERKQYAKLQTEISNYYSIPQERDLLALSKKDMREVVVESTYAYSKAHPQKINLALRELLKSDRVIVGTKDQLRQFVAVPEMLHSNPEQFKTLLRNAYKQHAKGLRSSANTAAVQETITLYEKTTQELRTFMAKKQRQPRWNAPLAERRLYNTLQLILEHNKTNTFYEAEMLKREIRTLLDQYPNRSFYVFEKDFKDFVATHHRRPSSLVERPQSSKREQQLFDEMVRYMSEGLLH